MLGFLWVLLREAVVITTSTVASTDIEVLVAVLALSSGHHRCVVLILGGLGPSSATM